MIFWLDEVGLADRPSVGNKAAVLGALYRAGFPIPDGFCIPWRVETLDREDLWREVIWAYERLTVDGSPVAVRSSGVGEDSDTASFAGQYETILNVQGIAELRSAIERCWASARSDRVTAYQRHRGAAAPLAVLVQRQVPAEVSGALFTADPVSRDTDRVIIEAVRGSGELLMSGHVAPIRCFVGEDGHVQSASADTLLASEQSLALAQLGRSIKDLLKSEQDIEWAIADGRIYVLQARPITYGPPASLADVWTRANIGEVLPGVVTPLTWHVFRATLLNEPARALTLSEEGAARDGVRRVRGRAYVRLDGLLDTFCYLPGVTPAVMHQALGVDLPPTASAYKSPRGMGVRLAQGMFLVDALGLLPRLRYLVRHLPQPPRGDAPTSDRLVKLIHHTADCFQLHLKCTAYAIGAFAALSHLSERWLPPAVRPRLSQALFGHEHLQTAAQGVSLLHLATQIRDDDAVRGLLFDSSGGRRDWSSLAQQLAQVPSGADFLAALDDFLVANGARTAEEFELATPRWREDPMSLFPFLRAFIDPLGEEAAREGAALSRRAREQAIAEIDAHLTLPQRWIVHRLLASYTDYATWRENVKYRLMEHYGELRRLFLTTGSMLAANGALERPDDVFFLTPAEAMALIEDRGLVSQPQALVRTRRKLHDKWAAQAAPNVIVGLDEALFSAPEDGLAGIGCSPGVAEGVARVLRTPSEATALKPNEVLVAPNTDPGWTPLFLGCRAVVTEIGGFLSHGAIVAREYGVPAVFNVRQATSHIHTGDVVRVDGTRGRVVVVSRSAYEPASHH